MMGHQCPTRRRRHRRLHATSARSVLVCVWQGRCGCPSPARGESAACGAGVVVAQPRIVLVEHAHRTHPLPPQPGGATAACRCQQRRRPLRAQWAIRTFSYDPLQRIECQWQGKHRRTPPTGHPPEGKTSRQELGAHQGKVTAQERGDRGRGGDGGEGGGVCRAASNDALVDLYECSAHPLLRGVSTPLPELPPPSPLSFKWTGRGPALARPSQR